MRTALLLAVSLLLPAAAAAQLFVPYNTGLPVGQPGTASDAGWTGIRIADVNGDGVIDVITGTGPGSAGHVKVFDGGTFGQTHSFFAYGSFAGGVFVAGETAIPEPGCALALPALVLLARRRSRV